MKVTETSIPDVKLIETPKFEDSRGYFTETYNQREFSRNGIPLQFVQDNHSLSVASGTVRGIHLQIHPFAQDKLVRVVNGSILDVAVDLRKHSPTYGQYVAVTLQAEDPRQLLVPIGFGHAFCTLERNTEVIYKVSNYYSPDHERGVIWSDPSLDIKWPITQEQAVVSDKDRGLNSLAQQNDFFT